MNPPPLPPPQLQLHTPLYDENDPKAVVLAQTDDLLDLFSATLRSLAADAAAIRQITHIADLLYDAQHEQEEVEVEEREQSQSQCNTHCNTHSTASANANADCAPTRTVTDVANELQSLDQLVSGVEQKVLVLRQIINGEKHALVRFETTLREEADEQASMIEGLMSALELRERDAREQHQQIEDDSDHDYHDHDRPGDNDDHDPDNDDDDDDAGEAGGYQYQCRNGYQHRNGYNSGGSSVESSGSNRSKGSSSTTSTATRRSRSSLLRSRSSGKGILANRNSSQSNSQSQYISPSHPSRAAVALRSNPKDSGHKRHRVVGFGEDNDNDNNENNSKIEIVSNTEISVEDVIDRPLLLPVTDDELQKKHTRFGPHMCRYDINEALEEIQTIVWKRVFLEGNSSHHQRASSNALSFESSNNNSGGDPVWHVSEQELRENCAFFKHGESTARSILQLLCSLKRLKQVPGRQGRRQRHSGGVTYVCLFGGTTKQETKEE
jgi:hypothetical protein